MSLLAAGVFRSLRNHNYRLWAIGAFVSNIGTWMQRIAQDWLVLTVLTHANATAVGIVTALQFGPQILLLPITGYAVDHVDRRKVLIVTQSSLAALALGLGLLTVTGLVRLWEVYGFAFLLGCVTAFDAPARQVFAGELVGEADVANAVALNSTSFNAARMIGPSLAGVLIAAVGAGWSFLINAASTLAVVSTLFFLRERELYRDANAIRPSGGLLEGFRYVLARPDIGVILAMLALFGAFGLNFALFISSMSVKVYHVGAGQFGLLTSCMAMGSVSGAVMAAHRERPRLAFIIAGAALFGASLLLAALMPDYRLFGAVLVLTGASAQTVTTSSIGLAQLSTDRHMRGRVMALLMAITMGGSALGAPFVGWVADQFGPRWALSVGAAGGLAAALLGLRRLRAERAGASARLA